MNEHIISTSLDFAYGGFTQKLKTITGMRICATGGCDTILSIYNKGPFCRLHNRQEVLTKRKPEKRWRPKQIAGQ